MRIAAEKDWNFTAAEITRVGQEISSTFGKVAHPLSTTLGELRVKVFIEIETVGPQGSSYGSAPKVQE